VPKTLDNPARYGIIAVDQRERGSKMTNNFYGIAKVDGKYQISFGGTMSKPEAKVERDRLNAQQDQELDAIFNRYFAPHAGEPYRGPTAADLEHHRQAEAQDRENLVWSEFHDRVLNG